MIDKMKNVDHIYNAILFGNIAQEICQMMIFRASSDKKINKLILESCCSPIVLSLELPDFILTLKKSDPIYKLVEREMNKVEDLAMGVA